MLDRILSSLPSFSGSGPHARMPLQPGQIASGKIVELYPNQRALVQIGDRKLLAHADVPLTKGAVYIFQASGREQSVFALKVLEKLEYSEQASNTGLLNSAGTSSRLSQVLQRHSELAQHLLRGNIPFSAEQLRKAGEWLISLPESLKPHGLSAAAAVFEKQLPVTEEILSAMLETKSGGSIKDSLQTLSAALGKQPNPSQAELGLKQMTENVLSLTDQRKAVHLLDMVRQASLFGKPDHVADGILRKAEGNPPPEEQIRLALAPGSKEVLFSMEEQSWLREKAKELAVLSQPKEWVRLFSALRETLGLGEASGETFRTLLEQAVNGKGPAAEASERLAARLNGYQLAQSDQPGFAAVWHHYPIQDERIGSDVSISFQLRKNPDNSIDPAFCRLVFYLELSSLGPVMADVHIQNRIVSATVSTEPDMFFVSPAANALLKTRFENLPYTFSGIAFKKLIKEGLDEAAPHHFARKGYDWTV
ncbi:hypothetical protein ACQCVE_03785 [Metabacillus sp. 113a]|uniref:hypothetical protein n=1 Tax=Metabacillus sp. 113a TaxID=3404706 RepID=UPI003CEE865E